MNKKQFFHCAVITLLTFFSLHSHAVKPFTVTCGDGEEIEVADSKFSPSGIALACLSSGHNPPLPSKAKPGRQKGFSAVKNNGQYKVFKTQKIKEFVARSSGRRPANVDHSDIILMLQGCECISPSCVAYRCPADVDIP